MPRIAIVGSRSFASPARVESYVRRLPADAVVVSGGAPGVDSVAENAARAAGRRVLVLRADWARHGRRAGPMRNARIVAHADRVVAFWNGRSRGTLGTVVLARRAGLPVEIYDEDGDAVPLAGALAAAARLRVSEPNETGAYRPA